MKGLPAVAFLLSVTCFAALVAPGQAEVVQKRGVRVSVVGKLAPKRLPRYGEAPVAVDISGRIGSTTDADPPQLQKLTISINRQGRLSHGGIPVCRLGHIVPSTTAQALAACRGSLVGEGHLFADVRIPEQSPFPAAGKVLAFYGKLGGRPAVLAHVYGATPTPTSFVLPFLIRSARGTFGTILEASLPTATGEWGFITGISLSLGRRGFLSAGCAAPKGLGEAVFPLLRATFGFAGGLNLTSTLNRTCKARG